MGAFVYEKQLKRHTLSELVPVESFDEETQLVYPGRRILSVLALSPNHCRAVTNQLPND